MSAVMRIKWENRLAKLIVQPGGARVEDMLAQADENLESVRDSCLEAVDRHLNEIEALHIAAGDLPSPDDKSEMYRMSSEIQGLAGVFGLSQLGEAAFSLCELIDRLQLLNTWRRQAVEVHLGALRLFRHPELGVDGEAVLAGLRKVTDQQAPKPQTAA